MGTTPHPPWSSLAHAGARRVLAGLHTLWTWIASLSWLAVGALAGAALICVHSALSVPDTTPQHSTLTFESITVRMLVSHAATNDLTHMAMAVFSMTSCFLASLYIRGDSRSLAARGERSAWVGGSIGHTIVRHGVECLALLAAVIVAWGAAHAAGLMSAAVLVAVLPLLGFLTSPGAFVLAGGTAALAHAGLGGWTGLAAMPVSSPVVPLFLATVWLVFSSADPADRFAHWWPVRRDVVGPLLALVWRRIDAATFDAALNVALVDAARLWRARGIALAHPVRITVHRLGTGVQIVADAQARAVVPFVAKALGRRVAGRIPPAGPPWVRTLQADSAHTQMAIAAARRGTHPHR